MLFIGMLKLVQDHVQHCEPR